MLCEVALDLVDLSSAKAKSILRYTRPAIHSALFILFIFFLFSRAYVSVPVLRVRPLSLSDWLVLLFSHALAPHRLMCAAFLCYLALFLSLSHMCGIAYCGLAYSSSLLASLAFALLSRLDYFLSLLVSLAVFTRCFLLAHCFSRITHSFFL